MLHQAETGAATGSHCGLSSLYRPFTAAKLTQSRAHRRRCKQKNTQKHAQHPHGARTSRIRDSARPQRTHAPSQAWTEVSPICHASASAVSSRKERAAEEEEKKVARTIQAASVGVCKEEAASPSQQLVQRQHQGVEAGKQAGGAGMRCVGGRIGGGGEGGGERHLGDACDARGRAAQRRCVRGE